MTQRRITPKDVLGFKQISDAQISPDGEAVAFLVSDQFISDAKFPKSNVWIVPTCRGEPQQLTDGPRSDAMPRWSPDGQSLAFLSDRVDDGQQQIYILSKNDGEIVQLTQISGNIPTVRRLGSISWSPDGRKISFLKTDTETKDEKERKLQKNDVIEFEKDLKYTRLYTVDVETKETLCISPDLMQIWEFCWSPSGLEVAVVASDLPFAQSWYTCRLAKFSLDGKLTITLHHGKRQVAGPTWSPDGRLIAFISSNWSDRGVVGGGVFVVQSDGGKIRELCTNYPTSTSWLRWMNDSQKLITAAHEQGSIGLAEIDVASGKRTSLWRGEAMFVNSSWPKFSLDNTGKIAVVREDVDNPPDIWIASHLSNGVKWNQLTHLHPQTDNLTVGSTESIYWKGADKWDIQGLLIRPPDTNLTGSVPMVTVVHGGPTAVHAYQYYASQGWLQLLANSGIAVFLPNPRGSTGWGLEFAESNIGDMGGKDWEDIERGIDYCIQNGIADRNYLGIAGWSYGGFMTAWAVTQTDRFKAAMMGAGISDWRSFHGKSYLCDWDAIHYGDADPWDPDGVFHKFSPITYVRRVKTPTLILHGEQDLDVPVEQSYLFYRALKDQAVETDLVIYPRETHSIVERNHIIDVSNRITEWFTTHLKH